MTRMKAMFHIKSNKIGYIQLESKLMNFVLSFQGIFWRELSINCLLILNLYFKSTSGVLLLNFYLIYKSYLNPGLCSFLICQIR